MQIHILRTVEDKNVYTRRHRCYVFADCYTVCCISDDGVRPSLTVIHLMSDDWSNCSTSLGLFSLLDLLLPWWMRAWFGCSEWVYVCWRQLWDLVCVYPWHGEYMRVVSVYIVCVCMRVCVQCVCIWCLFVEFFRGIHFHINEVSVSSTSVS